MTAPRSRRRVEAPSRAFEATVEFADGQKFTTVIRGTSAYNAAEAMRRRQRTDGTPVARVEVLSEIKKLEER